MHFLKTSTVLALVSLFTAPLSFAETVIINAEDDWAPYASRVNEKPEGFAVEVVREAFKAVGIDVEFRVVPYARCTKEVETLTDVVGCFDTARSAAVEEKYLWHKTPLFAADVLIWARADSTEKDLTYKNLIGKRVGMTNGYEYGAEFDNSKEITKEVSNSDDKLFQKLEAKYVDYVVAYEFPGRAAMKKIAPDFATKIKPVGKLSTLDLYVSFSKPNKKSGHFLELFNKGLDTIKQNGTYDKLQKELSDKLS